MPASGTDHRFNNALSSSCFSLSHSSRSLPASSSACVLCDTITHSATPSPLMASLLFKTVDFPIVCFKARSVPRTPHPCLSTTSLFNSMLIFFKIFLLFPSPSLLLCSFFGAVLDRVIVDSTVRGKSTQKVFMAHVHRSVL